MMYLSKLILNPRNPGARRDVARPYGLHRTLERVVEHAPETERLLFRIEPEHGPGGPVVLVQTHVVAPNWSPLLDNGYLRVAEGPKPFEPHLKEGQRLRFRLAANPTIKKKVEGKKHSTRVPLIHPREEDNDKSYPGYYDWLERRAERAGFEVLDARDATFRTASNRGNKQDYAKHEIPHFGVRFDGVLQVTDPARLDDALRDGIGPAKAFGFGLLSVALA